MFNNKLIRSNSGLIFLLLAQLCVSVNIVVTKHLVGHVPLTVLLTLRFLFGGIFLSLFIWIRELNQEHKFRHTISTLSKKAKFSIILYAMLGGFFFNIIMLTGLKYTSASMAGISTCVLPSLILILSYFILKERIKKHEILSIVIATFGVTFINISNFLSTGFSFNLIGDFLIILAILLEAFYTIAVKKFPVDISPIYQSALLNIINAFAFICVLLISPSDIMSLTVISSTDWFLAGVVLTFVGFMFFILWNHGLTKASTQQASIITAIVPAAVCVLAGIFLHEHICISEFIGIVLIISAIYIGSTEKSLRIFKKSTNNTTVTNSIEHYTT